MRLKVRLAQAEEEVVGEESVHEVVVALEDEVEVINAVRLDPRVGNFVPMKTSNVRGNSFTHIWHSLYCF